MDGIDFKRAWSLEAQEDTVLHVISRLYERGRLAVAAAPSPSAKVLVCVGEKPEAMSAGFVLQQMVQRNLQSVTCLVRQPQHVAATASFAVIILSSGVLEDTLFAENLLEIRPLADTKRNRASLDRTLVLTSFLTRKAYISIVSVNDGSFEFPPMEFYAQVASSKDKVKTTRKTVVDNVRARIFF